jgi:hypothetical protein
LADANGRFERERLQKARVAILVAVTRHRADLVNFIGDAGVSEIEGMRDQVVNALKEKNILPLPSGALEHYLPSYAGNEYLLDDAAKHVAIEKELAWLAHGDESDLASRYGELYAAIRSLPSKAHVNLDDILKEYLSRYIHEIQSMIISNTATAISDINARLAVTHPGWDRLFVLQSLRVANSRRFEGSIRVIGLAGDRERVVDFSDSTNAGMRDFVFRSGASPPASLTVVRIDADTTVRRP